MGKKACNMIDSSNINAVVNKFCILVNCNFSKNDFNTVILKFHKTMYIFLLLLLHYKMFYAILHLFFCLVQRQINLNLQKYVCSIFIVCLLLMCLKLVSKFKYRIFFSDILYLRRMFNIF